MIEFNSMEFINEIYEINTKFFVKRESNPTNHIIGEIKYIGESLCKDLIEINLDEKLKNFSHEIKKSYFSLIFSQNSIFQEFNEKVLQQNKRNNVNDSEIIQEILNKLAKIMIPINTNTLKATNNRSFQEISPNKRAATEKEEALRPAYITSIHLYIHEISLLINENIKVRILYNDVIIERNVNCSSAIEIYEILNYKEGKYIIKLEIFQRVTSF